MFGGKREQRQRVERIYAQIGVELRLHGPSSIGRIWLRAEVDAATISADVFLQRQDQFIIHRRPRTTIAILVRQLWSEFLLAEYERWWCLTYSITADGQRQVVYAYLDSFDARLTSERRRSQWIALTLPSSLLLDAPH